MRIAVWHNLPSGGAKRALYDQVLGLRERGHELEAWCPPTADQTYLPLGKIIPEHVVALKLSSDPNTNILAKMRPSHWSGAARVRAMDRHCSECARHINRGAFDLLLAAPCMFTRTTAIGRFCTIPSVLYLQEPYRWFYESLPELPWIALNWSARDLIHIGFWRKVLTSRLKLPGIRVQGREERRNAQAFDQILVNSFFSRESILRAYGLDAKVCYLGIDTVKFNDRHQSREPLAVSVGHLTPEKNPMFIIEALARVPAGLRPKLCWIANAVYPGYPEQVRRQAELAQVDFELKHRIDDSDLVDLLNRARMMLYAPRLEPFGYAPLEANACGAPVIGVAEGGVRETIQDGVNGLLVEHDPEAMASAICRLMTDSQLARRLGQTGQSLVNQKWSLSESIERLDTRLTKARMKSLKEAPGSAANSASL